MELEEPSERAFWCSTKANALQICMQAVQVCVGVTILLFGLAVGGVGLWAMLTQKDLIIISDGDPQLSRLPLSMIVAGIIVALLGLIGVVGGLFVRTVSGRILIGVYAFVLVLLIINEIGAGVSAVVFKDNLRDIFVESAERSLMNYGRVNYTSVINQWNDFQKQHFCCGADNFTSYRNVFDNYTVPASCCHGNLDEADCNNARMNATWGASNKLYLSGCPDSVIGTLKEHDLIVAIVVIVFAAAQFMGVLLACSMVYAGSRAEKKKKYIYKRLLQEQT